MTHDSRPIARFLELLGLCGLAVAQPVLAVFGDDPATFLARGVGRLGVVLFAVAVIIVPPLVLFAAEAIVAATRPRYTRGVHLTLVGLLAAVIVLGWIRGIGLAWIVLTYLALLAGLAVVVVRSRSPRAGEWARWLALGTPLFLLSFLFVAPTSSLVSGDSGDSAAEAEATTTTTPVLVITLDELPTRSLLDGDGRIDGSAYPDLARFSAESTWYRNHLTVADNTAAAVPALVSGVLPEADEVQPSAATLPGSLFTLFDDQADLVSFEWTTDLCPAQRCRTDQAATNTGASMLDLAGDAVSVFASQHRPDDPTTVTDDDFDAQLAADEAPGELPQRFADLLAEEARMPDLSFVHIALPHQPWDFLPDGHRYDLAPPALFGDAFRSDAEAELARSRHLLQLEFADRSVGRILERVRETGQYEDALIVITADHGVAFEAAAPIRDLTADNARDIAWTPLMIKYPGQDEAEIVDDPARLTDVVPTVAAVLDVEPSWELDGRDLRSTAPPLEASVPVRSDTRDLLVDLDQFETVLESDVSGRTSNPAFRVQSLHPLGYLIGLAASDLRREPAADVEAQLTGGLQRSYDPNQESAPVGIDGITNLQPGSIVAVAVNGRIGIVADVEAAGDPQRFRGVLPGDLFRPGRNELSLYAVSGDPSDPELQPIGPR